MGYNVFNVEGKKNKCCRCKNGVPRDGQRMCNACRASYERGRRPKRMEVVLGQARVEGFRALQDDLTAICFDEKRRIRRVAFFASIQLGIQNTNIEI